jgi:hypothetical protein
MIVQAIWTVRAGIATRSARLRYSLPMKSQFVGQVGQESHRRPAVVEHAARCPDPSRVVQIALESPDFDIGSSNGVQGRPASL